MKLDFRDRCFLANPYPAYAATRADTPVVWHESVCGWLVLAHAGCVEVLRAPHIFTSDARRLGRDVPRELVNVMSVDPPEHDGLRRAAGESVRDLSPDFAGHVRLETRSLVETASAGATTSDFIATVAEPAALFAISRTLELPFDRKAVAEATYAVVRSMMGRLDPTSEAPGLAARRMLSQLLSRAYYAEQPGRVIERIRSEAKRSNAPDDLVINSLRAVLLSGFNSVYKFLGNALLALLRDPAAYAAASRDGLDDRALNELARFDTPFQVQAKFAVQDTQLFGVALAKGDLVHVMYGAANRDPAVFATPDVLDLMRAPNPHLGFGTGPHACLGRSIAFCVARVVLGHALTEQVALAGDPQFDLNPADRGLAMLPVRYGG